MQNWDRGLTIKDTEYVFLDEGAYGTVFVDYAAGRVRKIMRRIHAEDRIRAIFDTEIEALSKACADENLKGYVACPVTEIATPCTILDREGLDVSAEFCTDLGFEAAFLEGKFHKIGDIRPSNRATVLDQFRAAGILHLTDFSAALDDDGNIVKVVDIATREIE